MDLDLGATMTSISKCGSMLELYRPEGGFSARPFLVRMMRVFGEGGLDADMGVDVEDGPGSRANEVEKAIEQLFVDIPVSRGQCEQAWIDLCGFVSRAGDGRLACFRPLATVKLEVWKKMVDGAVLQGIDLEKQFLGRDLWRSVLVDGEEPFPFGLFEAVLKSVCEEEGLGAVASVECEFSHGLIDECLLTYAGTSLGKTSCTRWVGETYLEAMAPTSKSAIGRSEFLNAWKDHLPESWRNEAALSKLTVSRPPHRAQSAVARVILTRQDGIYKHPDPTTICFMEESERQKVKKNLPTESGAAAKKTRNWHEFFRDQKRR